MTNGDNGTSGSELATRPNPQLTGFMPTDLSGAMEVAKALAYSDIVPESLRGKPGNVFVVMMYSSALNLPIAVGINTISVVKGRPKLEAKLVLSLVRKAGHRVEWVESTDERATLKITRGDNGDSFESTFTVADAVKAGLCSIQADGSVRARSKTGEPLPWERYARRMLRWRAVDEVTDVICPEVKMGFGVEGDEVPEEPPRPTLAQAVAQRADREQGTGQPAQQEPERDDGTIAAEVADIEAEHTVADTGPADDSNTDGDAEPELTYDEQMALDAAAYEASLADQDGNGGQK